MEKSNANGEYSLRKLTLELGDVSDKLASELEKRYPDKEEMPAIIACLRKVSHPYFPQKLREIVENAKEGDAIKALIEEYGGLQTRLSNAQNMISF